MSTTVNMAVLIRELQLKSLSTISQQSGVHVKTLMNIRNRVTKFPQHRTLVRLLPVLKLNLEFKKYENTI